MARKKTPDVMSELLGAKVMDDTAQEQNAPEKSTVDNSNQILSTPLGVSLTDAQQIIDQHASWAVGICMVPLPIVDTIALTGLQVRMLSVLARHYDVHFSDNAGRALIASLCSSLGAKALGRGIFSSWCKCIPVVGWVAGLFIMPATAGALTYAIGKVFVQHFAGGGTFITANPAALKKAFTDQYHQALSIFSRGRR